MTKARAEAAFMAWAQPGVYTWGRIDLSPFTVRLAPTIRRITVDVRVYRPDVERRQRRAMNLQFSLLRPDGLPFYLIPMLGWTAGLVGASRFGLSTLAAFGVGFLGCALGYLAYEAVYEPWARARLSRFGDYVRSASVTFKPGRQVHSDPGFYEAVELARELIDARVQEDRDRRWRELYDFLEPHDLDR